VSLRIANVPYCDDFMIVDEQGRRYSVSREDFLESTVPFSDDVSFRLSRPEAEAMLPALTKIVDLESRLQTEQDRGEKLADEMRWISDWAGNEPPIRQTINAVMEYADWARDAWRRGEP
jgi:hypothetical protein